LTELALLADALAAIPAARKPRAADLVLMTAKGVHHDHYRLAGRGLILRVPRSTPWAGQAEEQLRNEAEAFRRAAPARVTPRLLAVLPPSETLSRGALLVEEIAGRPPHLPKDLPAIAVTLARLHRLPLLSRAARPPLPDHGEAGPFATILAMIAQQRSHLDAARVAPETRAALDAEFAWAGAYVAGIRPIEEPLSLVGTDTHPGNFVIRPEGEAVLVDLERVCYGSPAIDLAHATLYTSTTWDIEVQAVLSRADVEGFYRYYLGTLDEAGTRALRWFLLPARRLTWLRTMLWAARWRALMESEAFPVDPRLADHISRRLEDFFAPETVARVRAEWLGERKLAV
jgi:phosphotransferase family enzyme